RYDDNTRGRIQALRPGYYTRMGAAIRQASRTLAGQPQKRKLLLLVTDGKPNDLDVYEGRYGVEDTRQAVMEARRAGLVPFCITIDHKAEDYLPYMFGANGYTLIKEPEQLPVRLPQLYRLLRSLSFFFGVFAGRAGRYAKLRSHAEARFGTVAEALLRPRPACGYTRLCGRVAQLCWAAVAVLLTL